MEAEPNCAMIIVGNKADIVEQDPSKRKVDLYEAKKYGDIINAEVIECSAATGKGVDEIFKKVVQLALQRRAGAGAAAGSGRDGNVVVSDESSSGSGKKCCS
jgi:GTPase SAR1 family protein